MEEKEGGSNCVNIKKKVEISDEERLELASKLDKELDEFINNLPKKKYGDGWSENRWEEEIEKHPFFMKTAPEPGADLHPLYEGLQKLKYDPEENEPEGISSSWPIYIGNVKNQLFLLLVLFEMLSELALAYKDDGNFHFKHKKYRLAILSYTEAIKIRCGNPEIEANLYNNRSAAHYFLKNYRSALKDCEMALKIKPNYDKVLVRAANCCFNMRNFNETIQYCEQLLSVVKIDQNVEKLRKKAMNEAKIKLRDERKQEINKKKIINEENKLINEIKKRGLNINGSNCKISIDMLQPHVHEFSQKRVYLDNSNNLLWPVMLVYPEHQIVEYILDFNELNRFHDRFEEVFATCPDWDKGKNYKIHNLNIYYKNIIQKKYIKVDINDILGDVLKSEGYVIMGGIPDFFVFAKNSEAEKSFLNRSF